MKVLNNLAVFGLLLVIVFSCDEIPPQITPCQTNRVVLVEEFTGVSCVNCPTGSEKLEQISAQNPGKVIVVGIHSGFFSTPNSSNNYFDLRTTSGDFLVNNHLGPVSGYPAATINRKMFEGESELPTVQNEWAGYIGKELCNRPIAELSASSTYNGIDSTATIVVDVIPSSYFDGLLEEHLAMTIMITESNIIGYQLTPQGSVPDYVHKHVFRSILSADYTGDILINKGNVLSAQQVTITDYKIPSDWNPDNCYVIAFIHNKGDGSKDVHQAIEIKLK